MKKRVIADVQMVREYLNVIILSLGILILQLYQFTGKNNGFPFLDILEYPQKS